MTTLTDRERMLAKKAAKPFLPPTLEDFTGEPRKTLPLGVFKHGNKFRIAIKQPDGKWKYTTHDTPELAAEARSNSTI
jgi:hypothetical protein